METPLRRTEPARSDRADARMRLADRETSRRESDRLPQSRAAPAEAPGDDPRREPWRGSSGRIRSPRRRGASPRPSKHDPARVTPRGQGLLGGAISPFLVPRPMNRSATGQAPRGGVFAAEGAARHWIVRAAVVLGAALLAVWVTAIALGVFGGFDSLPTLSKPRTESSGSTSSAAESPGTTISSESEAAPGPTEDSAPGTAPTPSGVPSSLPRPTASAPDRAMRTDGTPAGDWSGLGFGPGRASGEPVESPGDGSSGGIGAPGNPRY